jgi:hypothetical protein
VKPLRFQRSARREYDKAIARYEKQRPGLGLDFQGEVEAAITRLRENPHLGSRFLDTEYRYYVVHRFPFVIYCGGVSWHHGCSPFRPPTSILVEAEMGLR